MFHLPLDSSFLLFSVSIISFLQFNGYLKFLVAQSRILDQSFNVLFTQEMSFVDFMSFLMKSSFIRFVTICT